MAGKTVRIGGSSGFWGDTETAPGQLVRHGRIDYLVNDYLAEVTMSIMAAQKMKNPQAGYATDFVTAVMAPLAKEIADRGIKVVTNAGGVNPQACAEAVRKACEAAGVSLKVAVVVGDDLMGRIPELRAAGITEMGGDAPLPSKIVSINAYLGGFPIARALAEGADVVITGRCVDSAVTLGPLIHEFGWTMDDYDRLSAGTMAGHILECGAQCNGGASPTGAWCRATTTWAFRSPRCRRTALRAQQAGRHRRADHHATVAEQMLYEIGDPRAYLVPTSPATSPRCATSSSARTACGSRVRRAAAADHYKVSTTWPDSFKIASIFMLSGREAVARAVTAPSRSSRRRAACSVRRITAITATSASR